VIGRITANGKYMQSSRLRASNLSSRYNFEAGYNPRDYRFYASFVYNIVSGSVFFSGNTDIMSIIKLLTNLTLPVIVSESFQ